MPIVVRIISSHILIIRVVQFGLVPTHIQIQIYALFQHPSCMLQKMITIPQYSGKGARDTCGFLFDIDTTQIIPNGSRKCKHDLIFQKYDQRLVEYTDYCKYYYRYTFLQINNFIVGVVLFLSKAIF